MISKRRSALPGELEERSPEEEGEEVVKRTKNVCGLGGDVLAEMKVKQEKRASVIPKSSGEPNSSSQAEVGKDSKEPENPFGAIKLR